MTGWGTFHHPTRGLVVGVPLGDGRYVLACRNAAGSDQYLADCTRCGAIGAHVVVASAEADARAHQHGPTPRGVGGNPTRLDAGDRRGGGKEVRHMPTPQFPARRRSHDDE